MNTEEKRSEVVWFHFAIFYFCRTSQRHLKKWEEVKTDGGKSGKIRFRSGQPGGLVTLWV